MDLEEQKKTVLPYLQRAQEIQSVDLRVAYYCRLFAVDQGLRIQGRAKEITGVLNAALVQLEKDKAQLQPLEPTNDRYHCENFALNIFRRADKVDRAGRADASTAKAFYAASLFLDILNQFGDLEPDLYERQRYAAWRAVEIRKALREGRAPAPPPSAVSDAEAPHRDGGADDMPPPPPGGWPDVLPSVPEGDASVATDLPSPPKAGGGGAADSADELLHLLPSPPPSTSGAPPRGGSSSGGGGGGGPPPASAAGPRFRPGSRVLLLEPGTAPPGAAEPEAGTVGQLLSEVLGPGGVHVYRVALRDRLVDAPDTWLAPAVVAGTRVTYYSAGGAPGVGAWVLATEGSSWPPQYLVQCDDGRDVAASADQLSLAAPSDAHPAGGAPSLQPPPSGSGAGGGGGYPSVQPLQPPPPARTAPPPRPPPRVSTPPPSPPPPSSTAPDRAAPSAVTPAAAGGAGAAAAAALAAVAGAQAGFQPGLAAIGEAQKCAKYAVSSLSFDDVSGAVKYLSDALKLLTQPGPVNTKH